MEPHEMLEAMVLGGYPGAIEVSLAHPETDDGGCAGCEGRGTRGVDAEWPCRYVRHYLTRMTASV